MIGADLAHWVRPWPTEPQVPGAKPPLFLEHDRVFENCGLVKSCRHRALKGHAFAGISFPEVNKLIGNGLPCPFKKEQFEEKNCLDFLL